MPPTELPPIDARPSIKHSLSWMTVTQCASFGVQFASSVVVARYLTPYETGIFAVALATSSVLSTIQSLGLQALIVREEEITAELSATAFTVNLLISVLLSIAIVGISLLSGSFLGDARVKSALLALAIIPLFGIISFLPGSHLERQGRFRELALATMVATIASALTTIASAIGGASYMCGAYGQLCYGATMTAGVVVAGRRHLNFDVGLTSWRRVADFGLQMLAVTGVNSLANRLSDVVLGRMLGLGTLGIYSRASSLNGLIWNNIHAVASRVMLVDFVALRRSGQSLNERYVRTVDITTALLWPAFAGLAILARPLIRFVYGPKWVPAADTLSILAVASMILVTITMTWELFAATGNLRTQTRIELWRALASLAVFVIGCAISIRAAAAARIIDALFATILYRRHIDAMTDTSFTRDIVPTYRRSLLLTALATAPSIFIMMYCGFSDKVPFYLVVSAILSGIILWIFGLFVLKHPIMEEARILSRTMPAP